MHYEIQQRSQKNLTLLTVAVKTVKNRLNIADLRCLFKCLTEATEKTNIPNNTYDATR